MSSALRKPRAARIPLWDASESVPVFLHQESKALYGTFATLLGWHEGLTLAKLSSDCPLHLAAGHSPGDFDRASDNSFHRCNVPNVARAQCAVLAYVCIYSVINCRIWF